MRRRRNVLLALAVAALIGVASFTSYGLSLDRLSIDLLHLIHFRLFGPPPMSDDVAIVAVDEETYRDPHFSNLPQALWTPELGNVVDAVLGAEPKAVGVDIIIGTTADSIVPGYDRPWLRALQKGAKAGKMVLGYAQHQTEPVRPTIQQRVAVGAGLTSYANQHPANIQTDEDGVARSIPLTLATSTGQSELAFAAAVFQRATGNVPTGTADELLLNYADAKRPPIYSLADLRACAEAGDTAFFKDHFGGRMVLLGGVLDVEDRILTSGRFATLPDGAGLGPRCRVDADMAMFSGVARNSIPGVLVHAAALDNMLHDQGLRRIAPVTQFVLLALLAFLAALIFIRFKPKSGLPILLLLLALWSVASIVSFGQLVVLPLISGLIAMSLAAPAGLALRMGSMDRSRRQLRQAFSLYLPKSEVDRLVKEEKLPALGGELRDVTILFSDIASYSTLSERVAPGPLVDELNRYFGRMTDIVQAHGGFVDKFIGDGVLAIFGAPLARENAAADAVRASLAMIQSLKDDPLFIGGDGRIAIRIGLHRGEAIVGNIGSAQRFNYTVMGDAVNVASRLEGVGKHYGIPIVVSEQVQEAAAKDFAFRELDFIRVVGRDQPVRLFQPLSAESAEATDLVGFAAALQLWRKGQFAEAGKAFAVLAANGDELAARYVGWAQTYAETPMSNWEGIIQQGSK